MNRLMCGVGFIKFIFFKDRLVFSCCSFFFFVVVVSKFCFYLSIWCVDRLIVYKYIPWTTYYSLDNLRLSLSNRED